MRSNSVSWRHPASNSPDCLPVVGGEGSNLDSEPSLPLTRIEGWEIAIKNEILKNTLIAASSLSSPVRVWNHQQRNFIFFADNGRKLFVTFHIRNVTKDDGSQSRLGRYECHAFAVNDSVAMKYGFAINVISSKYSQVHLRYCKLFVRDWSLLSRGVTIFVGEGHYFLSSTLGRAIIK